MAIFLSTLPENKPAVLGVDLETTGLNPINNNLLSITLSDGNDAWIWLSIHDLKKLKPLLLDPEVIKVVHNGSFDLLWIKHKLGIDVVNVWDTLLVEKVITAGKELPASLYDVLARRMGVILDKPIREEFIEHPGFAKKPITPRQITYMTEDVIFLPELREKQLADIYEADLQRVIDLELAVLPIIVNLEYYGVKLDVEKWWEYQERIKEKIQEIESNLVLLLGEKYELSVERTRKGQKVVEQIPVENIKWNSPSQMKALLNGFDLTTIGRKRLTKEEKEALEKAGIDYPEDGKITVDYLALLRSYGKKAEKIIKNLSPKKHIFDSTGEPALVAYLEVGIDQLAVDFIHLLLEHRTWSKMAGWGYDGYVNPTTGKVHPNWRQLGADTGRLSCGDPNLQNVPRPREDEPNFRQLWIPDSKDYVIICADYSQQEPRILAQMCQDQAMLKACNSQDVYIEFAKFMFGRTVEKGSEERYIAKQFVLAVGYGAGADKLHVTSKLDLELCTYNRNLIRNTFSGMVAWAEKQYRLLQTYGYTTTLLGRRRYFPNPKTRWYTTAVNTPVQGSAADMMKLALRNINEVLTNSDYDARIWLTVHDEVEVMVRQDQAEAVLPLVVDAMEAAGKFLCPDVLHVAEAAIHTSWDK